MSDLARRRDAAAAIAVEAAALASRMRAEGGGVASLKGAQDFVTEADGATERFIRERLAQDFPGEAILGEEMGGAANGTGPLWVLDPIDGTSNFARGSDRWCVSIGLVMDGRAVAGAIARHAPAEVFAAAEGLGATLNGAPIRAAPTTDIGRAIIECGWSLRVPMARFHAMARGVTDLGAGLRSGGSGALGLVEAAAGRIDAYLELHINAWDAAAAMAIAREAGCWTNGFDSGDWLASGNPVGVGAPALGATLAALMEA
ncbi:inositol monophosphatase family protein [Neoroseomonas oryzicola]|uniref:Inositol monophosphatase n=1 Tax=Neoroseomonas oryzicola TaxID=535904 RepID=A0A9X9WCZ1_9PROT|nr:inositol monophosphatase [Neoroseomonas oryzicola]MBR0658201.1 inositol monophosphatase [Neoroseomonas oryzicola]NKE15982.1 inositol monophosphatase [Neoroseomonas oryzicola]